MNAPPPLPPPLLFAAGERRLAALDELARAQWLGSLINSQGRLEPRLSALAALRRDLLAGIAPDAAADWPPAPVAAAVAATFARIGLARYCRGQRELADTVLMSLLFHLDLLLALLSNKNDPNQIQAIRSLATTHRNFEIARKIYREIYA